jgi:hypothetical protein
MKMQQFYSRLLVFTIYYYAHTCSGKTHIKFLTFTEGSPPLQFRQKEGSTKRCVPAEKMDGKHHCTILNGFSYSTIITRDSLTLLLQFIQHNIKTFKGHLILCLLQLKFSQHIED